MLIRVLTTFKNYTECAETENTSSCLREDGKMFPSGTSPEILRSENKIKSFEKNDVQ